jgi:hypothetical protein
MKRFMLLPIAAPKLFNADFKKHARRFNKLRDSKTINAVRNVFTWKARRAAEKSETADQAVISDYRTSRGAAALAGDFSANVAADGDAFVAGAHTAEQESPAALDAEPILDDELAECSPADLVTGAEALLEASLEDNGTSSPEADKLLAQALDLVRQAGPLVEPE